MRLTVFAALVAVPTLASANEVLQPGFEECLGGAQSAQGISKCITDAQMGCGSLPTRTPGFGACYKDARAEWSTRTSALIKTFDGRPDNFQKLAIIETKYSLLRHLMACDRQEELNQIDRAPLEEDLEAKLLCQSTAAAAAYTELLIRSGTIKR